MTEHSATPWQVCHHLQSAEKDASCKCGYRGGIWGDAGNLLVCEMRNCDLHEGHDMTPVGDRATQLANADFIVKAVNNHDALVKALQDALCELSACAKQMICAEGGSVHRAQIAARGILAVVSRSGDGK